MGLDRVATKGHKGHRKLLRWGIGEKFRSDLLKCVGGSPSNMLVGIIKRGGYCWQRSASVLTEGSKHSNRLFANGGVGCEIRECGHESHFKAHQASLGPP